MNLRREKCKTCEAEIVWVPHATTGRRAPIDADPVRFGGNILVEETAAGPVYRILKKGEPGVSGQRYRSHFSTCGQATDHRKAKQPQPEQPILPFEGE